MDPLGFWTTLPTTADYLIYVNVSTTSMTPSPYLIGSAPPGPGGDEVTNGDDGFHIEVGDWFLGSITFFLQGSNYMWLCLLPSFYVDAMCHVVLLLMAEIPNNHRLDGAETL